MDLIVMFVSRSHLPSAVVFAPTKCPPRLHGNTFASAGVDTAHLFLIVLQSLGLQRGGNFPETFHGNVNSGLSGILTLSLADVRRLRTSNGVRGVFLLNKMAEERVNMYIFSKLKKWNDLSQPTSYKMLCGHGQTRSDSSGDLFDFMWSSGSNVRLQQSASVPWAQKGSFSSAEFCTMHVGGVASSRNSTDTQLHLHQIGLIYATITFLPAVFEHLVFFYIFSSFP